MDINVYGVFKCFDTMWLLECINDLYDAGIRNYNLCLLYMSNRNAKSVFKTSSGTTQPIDIRNKVMQGRVWGGPICCLRPLDAVLSSGLCGKGGALPPVTG